VCAHLSHHVLQLLQLQILVAGFEVFQLLGRVECLGVDIIVVIVID